MNEYRNKQGNLHRTDGPAIEYEDGTKSWYHKGKIHREDGPAIECPNGDKQWWVNGELHRTDGPAITFADGTKQWWVNGELVYSNDTNNLSQFQVSESFKRSIVKYRLAR